ncbi:MAG: hypothetical protein AB1631_16180, partial [Acidobacteriota bacterium]
MKMKRAVLMASLVVAIAALALPSLVRTSASGRSAPYTPAAKAAAPAATPAAAPAKPASQGSSQQIVFDQGEPVSVEGKLSPDIISNFFTRLPKGMTAQEAGRRIGDKLKGKNRSQARLSPQSGQPELLSGLSALSAAVITTIGGRDTQFSEVALLADWDGRQDCVADHAAKVDDFSEVELDIDQSLTRAAISEHTFANGFNENIFYYGDSVGNVWVGADTTGDGQVDLVLQINLPT